MLIQTADGKHFTGRTAADVVKALAEDSRTLSRAPDAFRWQVSQICLRLYKMTVDPSTDDSFLNSLAKASLIKFKEEYTSETLPST